MQTGDPRGGSTCLPTGPNWWRPILTAWALILGVCAGWKFHAAFDELPEAIIVGLTSTEIALRVTDVIADLVRRIRRTPSIRRICRTPSIRRRTSPSARRAFRDRSPRFPWFPRFFGGPGSSFVAPAWGWGR